MDLEGRVTDSGVSANDESADSVQPSEAVSKKRRSMDPHFACDSTTRPVPPWRFRVNRRRATATKSAVKIDYATGQRLNRFNAGENCFFAKEMTLEAQPELRGIFKSGAGGGSRTHTPLRATDFESAASAIPPLRLAKILHDTRGLPKACSRAVR